MANNKHKSCVVYVKLGAPQPPQQQRTRMYTQNNAEEEGERAARIQYGFFYVLCGSGTLCACVHVCVGVLLRFTGTCYCR